MSFDLTWEDDGVTVIFGEDLDDESYLACNKAIISDPRFSDIKYVIRNYLKVLEFPLKSSTIQKVAIIDASIYRNNSNLRIAIISSKDIIKGLHNMFLAYFRSAIDEDGWETSIFDNLTDAEAWVQ